MQAKHYSRAVSCALVLNAPFGRCMLTHPQFDAVALQIGPVAIHWYGLTYLVAFGLFLWLASLRVGFANCPTAINGLAGRMWRGYYL